MRRASRRGPDRHPERSEDERHRRRLYAAVMVPCLVLIVPAWTVVRLFSVRAAIGMSLVAMVLPPIASILANAGREQ